MYAEKGSPRSRAKDHVIRLAVARKPMTAHQSSTIIKAVIAVTPLDPVPLSKTWMDGKPISVF